MLLHARKERNTIQYWADKNGEETKAINLYNIILRSQTAMYGCNGQCAVETKGLMCMIYVELDKFKEAQHCLTGVLQWQRENLEEHHPAVQKADDLSCKDVSTQTWTTEWVGRDSNISDTKSAVCHENFQYHEIVSCTHKPMGAEYWMGKKARGFWSISLCMSWSMMDFRWTVW